MGSSTKSGRKSMAHKSRFDSKEMDTDGNGTVSKEEYIAHHEIAYDNMKQTNGGVSIKDMNAVMNHGTSKANKLQPSDMNH